MVFNEYHGNSAEFPSRMTVLPSSSIATNHPTTVNNSHFFTGQKIVTLSLRLSYSKR